MGKGDFPKVALVLIALGFQLYAVTMAMYNFGACDNTDWESTDDAIKAFLIIGFLVYAVVFILLCLMVFGDLGGNKVAMIATVILGFIAVACEIIGLAIYGADCNNNRIATYPFTSYTMGGSLGLIGSILLVAMMC